MRWPDHFHTNGHQVHHSLNRQKISRHHIPLFFLPPIPSLSTRICPALVLLHFWILVNFLKPYTLSVKFWISFYLSHSINTSVMIFYPRTWLSYQWNQFQIQNLTLSQFLKSYYVQTNAAYISTNPYNLTTLVFP